MAGQPVPITTIQFGDVGALRMTYNFFRNPIQGEKVNHILHDIDIFGAVICTPKRLLIDQLPCFLLEEGCEIVRGRHDNVENLLPCFGELGQLRVALLIVLGNLMDLRAICKGGFKSDGGAHHSGRSDGISQF